jgi:hypothetical protein
VSEEEIRDTINNTDVKAARNIFERSQDLWKGILNYKYGGGFYKFREMVMDGVEAVLPDYQCIETNWELASGRHHAGSGTWINLISR